MADSRPRAVILAVGSELTTGSTRDTNSGQLAAELNSIGVEVLWIKALPDRLEVVAQAFRDGLQEADLVVSTGGLGPTPDDLTREAIAATTGREPAVDPTLERWLSGLFHRRGIEMPQSNLKQAWLLAGTTALPNPNGTAPGWWVEVEANLIIALPGPPREMWPMWQAEVRPRLAERGVGGELASETLRLAGIGESALVELIGEQLLRGGDPEVATYARPDAVDVRVSARGPGAAQRVRGAVAELVPRLEPYLFSRGSEGWPEALARLLGDRTIAMIEIGTGGQLVALLGGQPYVVHDDVRPSNSAAADLPVLAQHVRAADQADFGLAVRATERDVDTRVEIAIATADAVHAEERTAFLAGSEGRRRAALVTCHALWQWLHAD